MSEQDAERSLEDRLDDIERRTEEAIHEIAEELIAERMRREGASFVDAQSAVATDVMGRFSALANDAVMQVYPIHFDRDEE